VWFAWVGDNAGETERFARELLSGDEREHLNGYRIREAAERYIVTRALVRSVLSERLGVPAPAIRVSRTDTGKPIVTEGVHFNVSHSGDLVLLAVSDDQPVGVDIERKRPVLKVNALTQRWLSDLERANLARLRELGIDESDSFLRIWSLKEAQLKALGVGISGSARAELDRVHVMPLDELLDPLSGPRDLGGYVGAIAFAHPAPG
jgi:4'-phosphopantetheinyl transferase